MEKIFRGFQCHVSRADEKQFPRPPLEKMRVVEIGILCHDNPFLLDGNFIERPIPGKVPAFNIRGVHRIVSRRLKNLLQGGGKMSVDEGISCRHEALAFQLQGTCRVKYAGLNILFLQIGKFGKDFIRSVTGCKIF